MQREVCMKFSIWADEEVKSLFDDVEVCKEKNKSLKEAFSEHAKKFHRKTNSVRNYYYHEVDNLQNDDIRRKRLNIDLSKHVKNKLIPFSKEQEDKFLSDIKNLTEKGMSVRSACFQLSGGDMTLMTRLQNKFQNLKKDKKEEPNNIITFRKKQKLLTDNDINSLFLGLVKLIKKTTTEEVTEKFKDEKETKEYLLKKAYLELNKKEKELSKLKDEFELLKSENLKLSAKEFLKDKKDKLKEKLTTKTLMSNIKA